MKLYSPNFQYLVAWPLALITCLSRLGRDRYKFEMYTLEMEYQILVTVRIRSPLEWMVCCFRCSRILINLQMFSIILGSGDWDGQSRQSTSLLSFHNCVCTDWCTWALSSWKIHWLFSNFATTGQRLLSRMSMYLDELIFPSTSVIVPTPSLHIHPQNITDTRAPPLRLPYNHKRRVPPFLGFPPHIHTWIFP